LPGYYSSVQRELSEASQPEGNLQGWEDKNLLSPPGCFLPLLWSLPIPLSLCLSLWEGFEELDFIWPFSPYLKGTGCWGAELARAPRQRTAKRAREVPGNRRGYRLPVAMEGRATIKKTTKEVTAFPRSKEQRIKKSFFCFVSWVGVGFKLLLAKLALYYLSHTSSPFWLFWR
jgi:hypothetical protein